MPSWHSQGLNLVALKDKVTTDKDSDLSGSRNRE